jgi:phospholipid/cholesterol/gamma-HCH transport system permease protein
MLDLLAGIGRPFREFTENVGFATRTFFGILRASGGLWRRPRLIIEQIHFIGNYSLIIIAVSGLFVGMVLGLQGFRTGAGIIGRLVADA